MLILVKEMYVCMLHAALKNSLDIDNFINFIKFIKIKAFKPYH
jgi:hypothetical protein